MYNNVRKVTKRRMAIVTVAEILNSISKLSAEDQKEIRSILLSSSFTNEINLEEFVTEEQFESCPTEKRKNQKWHI